MNGVEEEGLPFRRPLELSGTGRFWIIGGVGPT
jgi:hypothetical protein